MAAPPRRRYDERRIELEGPALPDHPEGPWSLPPAAPATSAASRPRRNLRGLALWLGLMALGGALFFGLQALFPGQLTSTDQADGLRLLGLLALVSSGLVFARQINIGVAARHLSIWVAIAAVLILGYSFRSEIAGAYARVRGELIPAMAVPAGDHAMTVTASDDGGFYVMGQVNGAPVRFAIDTGANGVLLSPADAQRAGIDTDGLTYGLPSETANGVGYMAPVTLGALDIGPIRMTGVAAAIDKAPMSTSLLGMAFLRKLDSFEVKGDQLTLRWKG